MYSPMRHTPGLNGRNRRFFICDSYMTMTEFMASMDADSSPSVIIESQQEGSVTYGMDSPRYAMYFVVRAREMNDGKQAIEAKRTAKQVMMDFVNFVRAFKYHDEYGEQIERLPFAEGSYLSCLREAIRMGDRCMENVGIEDFAYESLNQMYDGWYGIQVSFSDVCPYNMCIDVDSYIS